jgi:O-antigen ligase
MTTTARLSGRAHRERLARAAAVGRLAAGAALLVAAMPVAMALANRSAPVILVLAAVIVLASAVAEAGWRSLGPVFAAMSRSWVAPASAAFIGLAIISCGWSVDPSQSLRALEEGALPVLTGAVLLCFLPRVAPRWTGLAVAAGVIVAGLISILELRSGMPLRKALHLRAMAFEYNRPVLTLLALFWPLFALAISSGGSASSASAGDAPPRSDDASRVRFVRNAHGARLALWSALSVTTMAIWVSQSGTAMFAQILSLGVALLAWRFPRASLLVTGIAVTIVFISVFAFGDIAWRVLPASIYDLLAWAHAADRVEIWRSFGAAAMFHPLLGAGMGTSVTLGNTAVASEVASEFRRMLDVGHPHNGYLQIGVELGVVGCLIALLAALAMLWSWRDLDGPPLCARIGLFTMVAATMLVGHGAWQAWWLAVIFVAAALVRTIAPRIGRPAL